MSGCSCLRVSDRKHVCGSGPLDTDASSGLPKMIWIQARLGSIEACLKPCNIPELGYGFGSGYVYHNLVPGLGTPWT